MKPRRQARPMRARARGAASIPRRGASAHTHYLEIANLEMSRGRYETMIAGLEDQLARYRDEVAAIEARVQELRTSIDQARAPQPEPARARRSHHAEQNFTFEY